MCYVYEFKYVKCHSPHKAEYHMEMAWYCKVNFKINSPRLETKKDKSCLHSFKYTAKGIRSFIKKRAN